METPASENLPNTRELDTIQQHSDSLEQPDTTPNPLPIDGINHNNCLSSNEIKKNLLKPVDYIVQQQPKTNTSNAGKLVTLLARESIFGIDILKQCTPLGASKCKGLPTRELFWLKQIMLSRFPEYWNDVAAFETVWKKCQVALEHCCSGLRRKAN